MVIYLRGEDDYRSEETLRTLIDAFQKKHDPAGFSIARLDGELVRAETLQRALATQGMLTKRRLVTLRSLSQNRDRSVLDFLQNFLQDRRWPAENVLIVWERGAPESGKRGHPVFGLFAKLPPRQPRASGQDFQQRFDPLVGRQLEQWVDRQAAARRIRLAPDARNLLISLTGSDLRAIATELEKLSHYRPGATITEPDVRLFVHGQLETSIFDLTDTLGERDFSRALQLLERQLLAGAHPLYLVTMLTRQFRILRQVEAAGQAHPATLARQLKLHPFVVSKAREQVRRFTRTELVALFEAIVDLDERLKTGATDPAAELTLFVARACRTQPDS